MTWGLIMDVAAPAQVYDAMHARVLDRPGSMVDGLLVHVARATDAGFQIIEVWESRDDYERSRAELVGLLADVPGEAAPAGEVTEFDVRGLVVPAARIAV